MFEARDLPPDVERVRDDHASDAVVLDTSSDFETLPGYALDDIATRADALTPTAYDPDWLPDDSPELLRRLASGDLVVGMPGDGSVAWTRQTDPEFVLVKPRVEGAPDDFVDFLVAEALVELGLGLPEHFLGFFADAYPEFASAVDADPTTTYQVALAAYDAYRGLHTRDVFASWEGDQARLHDAWRDAGDRLHPRLDDLSSEVARGTTDFGDAAELACSAVKHNIDVPTPFGALDTLAYRDHGPQYAVKWAEKLF
ncbi:hypothetical protein [Salarchaeum sp. JOR-1]|uniref:DUF7089 family protein n=1 Tax=Salarchaeum sp. JOR-1 TaxID=2599399 RepID=UPI00119878A1|nr:hypothetical protein [Salarchaeum sp. JOR-1]QDX40212.1 hypothetical protein FQU85_04620 [Salarchaeum sp. JOR-1]